MPTLRAPIPWEFKKGSEEIKVRVADPLPAPSLFGTTVVLR